jgi:hypothetical protein
LSAKLIVGTGGGKAADSSGGVASDAEPESDDARPSANPGTSRAAGATFSGDAGEACSVRDRRGEPNHASALVGLSRPLIEA